MTNRLRTPLLRSLIAAATGVMAFVLLGASPAAAHYVYEEAFTYRSNDLCVFTRSEISHGDGNGYARVDVSSHTILAVPPAPPPCAWAYERPVGYISAQIQTFVWSGVSWLLCDQTNYVYNDTTTWELRIQARMIGQPICGPGLYGTMGTGFVWNNAWYGGSVWSGTHVLPDHSRSVMAAPNELPEPGDTIGVADASGAPVLDADGEPVTLIVGAPPVSGPDGDDVHAGTTVVAEDGSVITEVDLHPAAEVITR